MAKTTKLAVEQILDKLKEDKLIPQKATLADVEDVFAERVLTLIENLESRLSIAYDEISAYQDEIHTP